MPKDINRYWDLYSKNYSFESINLIFREKKLIEILDKYKPKNILEIGCGYNPISLKYKDFKKSTLIEPGKKPYNDLCNKLKHYPNIKIINNFFENLIDELKENVYDFIIIDGVLHEVENSNKFLKLISNLSNPNTYIYINVPNANSLHRKIALEMKIIDNIFQKSNRNKIFEQKIIYSLDSLTEQILTNIPKSKIINCESFFLKPFTHEQMMSLVKEKIINLQVLNALYSITDKLNDLGSEIFCLFKAQNK